jgi:hypothetical protein
MRRLLLGLLVCAALAGAVALSRSQTDRRGDGLNAQAEERNPWTHLNLNNDPDTFRFAIVSDRTGGHRGRVFSQAVEQLNVLQPEFVVSVGDLIEGYTETPERLAAEWKEFQGYVARLQMPFFYVAGNHDVSNPAQVKLWKEKFGRSYYSFTYKNVLFLALDSEQPHGKTGGIGMEQLAFVRKTLKETADVRWTFVLVHRPLWDQADLPRNGWLEVEKALAGRDYTVFAGHIHRFRKFVRQGMNYYQLATTGGGSRMRGLPYGEVDQIAWVTMKKDGPVIANILLDGVLTEDMRRPVTDEAGVAETNRKPTHPARGKVWCDGTPAVGTVVTFFLLDPEGKKKPARAADALVEADGSFVLTTYRAGDGAPAGDYVVTVMPTPPYFPQADQPARKTPVPEAYAGPETTPLKATVKSGGNDFTFELKREQKKP